MTCDAQMISWMLRSPRTKRMETLHTTMMTWRLHSTKMVMSARQSQSSAAEVVILMMVQRLAARGQTQAAPAMRSLMQVCDRLAATCAHMKMRDNPTLDVCHLMDPCGLVLPLLVAGLQGI